MNYVTRLGVEMPPLSGRVKRSPTFGLLLLGLGLGLAACEAEDPSQFERTEQGDLLLQGGTVYTPTGIWESIGQTGGCTATLITEYAALTAGHCVDSIGEGGNAMFTLPNGRGSVQGTVHIAPQYELDHWLGHDLAVIQFDDSIYRTAGVNAVGLTPIPISDEAHPVGTGAFMWGYGSVTAAATKQDPDPALCGQSGGGDLRYSYQYLDEVNEDWHYANDDNGVRLCPGDSGGPLVASNGRYQVIAVNSWVGTSSVHKPTYIVADWIKQNSGPSESPGDTWGHCVLYDQGVDSAYLSFQGDLPSLSAHGFDQMASTIWVKKGYRAELFDWSNYSTSSWTDALGGFTGETCDEFGCQYDLTNTTLDNDLSSVRCVSAIPNDTWGDCVLYEEYDDGAYLSVQGKVSLDGGYDYWDNRAGQVWVKAGHTAELHADFGYDDTIYWGSTLLDGYNGDWCNQWGCMHDLMGTYSERTTSSIDCQ